MVLVHFCIFYFTGKCFLRHICVDEYNLFLPLGSPCSYRCTSRRLHLPRDSKVFLPVRLSDYSGNSQARA
uniref:Uncharacterized protein n=1 Tax=Salix viminalis TaxID=40686 RepID=A0A6N2N379_SALVM